jgi:hypothetical protein
VDALRVHSTVGAAHRVAKSAASFKVPKICREQIESRYPNETTNSSGSRPVRVLIQALRELTLLTEEIFRIQLMDMSLSCNEVNYQLERARGLHLSVR